MLLASSVLVLMLARLGAGALDPSCDYCALNSGRNTFCRFRDQSPDRAACGEIFANAMTPEERREALRLHNALRRRIAKGQEPYFRHQAANMLELQWDEELATGAKLWAERCDFGHDKRDICRFNVGQNLYMEGSNGLAVVNWTKVSK